MPVTLAQDICTSSLVKALNHAGYTIHVRGHTMYATNGRFELGFRERAVDISTFDTVYTVSVNGDCTRVTDMDEDGWTLWLTKLELRGGL